MGPSPWAMWLLTAWVAASNREEQRAATVASSLSIQSQGAVEQAAAVDGAAPYSIAER